MRARNYFLSLNYWIIKRIRNLRRFDFISYIFQVIKLFGMILNWSNSIFVNYPCRALKEYSIIFIKVCLRKNKSFSWILNSASRVKLFSYMIYRCLSNWSFYSVTRIMWGHGLLKWFLQEFIWRRFNFVLFSVCLDNKRRLPGII